ncbi:MAG: MFS transporter [marine bacterium B5-7]|nr:MAG: MFS transporter [marine bacterium B5-7]
MAGKDEKHSQTEEELAPNYRWYVLLILGLTYASSYMDRQILSILLEDLKLEFSLSDTQLGLLSGIAFAVFYASLGIPIARLADRFNRVNIIVSAVSVWSVMTVLCGAVSNFTQLFLARVGVGVGEAGGTPPAHSMISDYFTSEERSFAISIYSMGTAFGSLLGLILGGYIAELFGWRMAFIAAGLPGLIIAIIVKLSVKEPCRGAMDGPNDLQGIEQSSASVVVLIKRFWSNPIYRSVAIAHVLAVFVAYAISSWLPTLYLRQYELGQGVVGTIVGLLNLIGGVSGLLCGGYLAGRLAKKNRAWLAFLPFLSLLLAFPMILVALWLQDIVLASVFFGLSFFFYQASHGPGLAIIQLVASSKNRAQAAAFVFFLTNLFGLGLGPLLVGFLSDLGFLRFGENSLPLSMGLVSTTLLFASFYYWRTALLLRKYNSQDDSFDSGKNSSMLK